jgi:hypothetical protein
MPAPPPTSVAGVANYLREDVAVSELPGKRGQWSWWYLLFLVQFVAVLWPPFYNSIEPSWHGVPFFYWFQMLWVLLSALLNAVVYFATRD